MNNSSGRLNAKAMKILKRALALVLSVLLVTGLGLSYSADRILEATSVPDEVSAESHESEDSGKKDSNKDKDDGLSHEDKEIVIDDQKGSSGAKQEPEKQQSSPEPSQASGSSASSGSGSSGDSSSGTESSAGSASSTESASSSESSGSSDSSSGSAIEIGSPDNQSANHSSADAEIQDEASMQDDAEDSEADDKLNETDAENEEGDEEPEEEEKRPAQKLTARASDGATVVVNAPEGALPEGSTVTISVVSAAEAINAVDEMLGDNREVVSAKAYDITIHGPDGREIQPDSSVRVSLTGAGVGSGEETELYHMQNGNASKVVDVSGSSANFSSSHFSVYVFVEIDTAEQESNEAGIVLSDKLVRLESIGHFYQIEVTFRGIKGNTADIVWTSDNPSVVSVDDAGKVTALAYGTAVITASYTDGEGGNAREYTAALDVEVSGAEAISMVLNRNTVELSDSGETTTLGVTFKGLPEGTPRPEIEWTTSDENVVSVEDGAVTAVSAGTAVITASSVIGDKTYRAQASVTVRESESAIRLSPETFIMKRGETADIRAVLAGLGSDTEVIWASSNKSIAEVSADGLSAVVTATGVGRATITAKVKDGRNTLTAEALIKVSDSGTWSNGTSEMNWEVNEDGVLSLSGNGELMMSGQNEGGFAKSSDAEGEIGDTPWKEWRNSITEVVVGEGITTIGSRAFEGCQNLYKITFNNKESLKKIGFQAFYRCHKLIEIDLSGCSNLEEIEGSGNSMGAFSHGAWTIDRYSSTVERSMVKIDLTGCTSLKTIGGGAFYGRRYIDFDMSDLSGLEVIGEGALEDKHEFNSIDFTKLTSLKELGTKSLRNNTGVVVVDLSGNTNLTTIGYGAFLIESGFTSTITRVDLSGCSELTSIGANAFAWNGKGNKTLTTVDLLGTGITEIKDKTFLNQAALVSVSIPDGVNKISSNAFSGCTSIRDLVWDAKDYTANKGNIGDTFKSISDKSQLTVTIGADVEKLPADFFSKLDGASFVFAPSQDGGSRTVRMNLDGTGYKDYIIDSAGHIYLKTDETMADVGGTIRKESGPLWIEYETADDLVYNGENQNIIQTRDPEEGTRIQYKVGKNGTWNDVAGSVISALNAGLYEIYFRTVEAAEEGRLLYEAQKAVNVTVGKANIPVRIDTHALEVKPGEAYDFSNRVSGDLPEGVRIEYSFGIRASGTQGNYEYFGSVDDFKSVGRTLNGSKYRAGTTTGVDIILIRLRDTTGNYNEAIYKIPVRVLGDPRMYTVTFKANGGTFDNDGGGSTITVTGPAGTGLSAPRPYRDGYRFDGWNSDVPSNIMKDATYSAKWTKYLNVTLTAASASKDYDGLPLTADSVSASGLPDGYTVQAHAVGTQTDAGTSANIVNDNYVIRDAKGNNVNDICMVELKEGELRVNSASTVVKIKGASAEAVYDGNDHSAAGYEIVSISNPGYTASDFSFTGEASASGRDAGTYPMNLSQDQFVNKNENYGNVSFEITDGSLTVLPREVTVTANNAGKSYGEDDPEFSAGVSGLLEGDSIDYTLERSEGEDAGDYDITASGSELQGNYKVSYVPAVFTISSSEVLVIADNQGKIYGDRDPAFTVRIAGLKNTDDASSIRYTVSREAGEDAGTYRIIPEGEARQGNYDVRFIEGSLNISRRQLTVRAISTSKDYGASDPEEFGVSVEGGLKDGDEIAYEVSRAEGEDVREGGYAITPSGDAVQGNYNITYEPGVFTINPLDGVEVTITGHTGIFNYDGNAHAVSGYTVRSSDSLYLIGDIDYSGSASVSAVNASEEPVMMGLTEDQFSNNNPNFSNVKFIVEDGYIRIDPIDVSVRITGHTGSAGYDGTEHKTAGYDVETGNSLYSEDDFEFSGKAEAARTDTGRTPMGLEASQFVNKNENFRNVTFDVTDGYQEITAADEVVVSITGAHSAVSYDGRSHAVSGYDVSISSSLYSESDFAFTPGDGAVIDDDGNITASGTDAGTYYMGLTSAQFVNNNKNFSKVTFNVTDGYQQIDRIGAVVTVTGNEDSAVYDGEEHSVSGYKITSDTPLYNTDRLVFTGSAGASRKDAGTTMMGLDAGMFTNTDSNFSAVTVNVTDGSQTITPASAKVQITGRSSTVPYDGTAHEIRGYDVSIEGDLYSEEDIIFSGEAAASQSDAGTAYMGLAADQFSNGNSNFASVTFSVTDGFQTVEPADAKVSITGKSSVVPYDGAQHSVSGYDAVIEGTLYTEDDFEFTGTAETAAITDVGTAEMGLTQEQFVNKNDNFRNVTFEVTDGFQTVEPIDAEVTITGHHDTCSYDGNEHSISGYDVEITGELYREEDFTFTPGYGMVMADGKAGASRTDEGISAIGLAPEQFRNRNSNFRTVTFHVTDGYQKIVPVDEVVVTITGHTSTEDYDGRKHSVSGYDVAVSNELYKESDIVFSGTDSAARTSAGTSFMGLEPGQFTNKNSNFTKVTFEVTDGWQKVAKINASVDITGNSSTLPYDGREHSVSGYEVEISGELYKESDISFSGSSSAARTDAGTSWMGLSSEQFTNTNPNFGTVTFNVTDGYQKVSPVDVTVEITGHTGSVSYDGREHSVSGCDISISSPLYKAEDFSFSGLDTAAGKNAGTYPMGLSAGQFANNNSNFSTVTFRVTDGSLEILPVSAKVTITGQSLTFPYDGMPHSASGYTAAADTPLYDTESAFEFTGDASTGLITDAGTAEMKLAADQFVNTDPNFSEVTFDVTDGAVTVLPVTAEVEITGRAAVSKYDGNEHSVSGYDVMISNPLYKASDISFSGNAVAARTDEGTTEMGLAPEQFSNTNPNFSEVTFNVTDGYQTVTPADEVVVRVIGRTEARPYDGGKHSVSGYDLQISDPLYSAGDFTFSGSARVERTDAGRTAMGLSSEQFSNNNRNFSKVTFDVTDGYIEIGRIDAIVTVEGASSSEDYDGKAHSAEGYAVTIGSPLYKEDDFTFTGSAAAERTDAGTTYMGLTADQFVNNNDNFGSVRFVVRDGSVTVRPVKASVTIEGHNNTSVFDGTTHMVNGYDVSIDSELYTEADFTFSGSREAARTDAGRTEMGLKPDQFVNTSSNFTDVTFNVIDGYQTVIPAEASVSITGHCDISAYDGNSHSVSGYDVSIDNPLYTENDFSFSGSAAAARTDAGTTEMGLEAESFRNTNRNFGKVTFNVVDGFQKIRPRDVAVTITGRSSTATYDGTEHMISGYDVLSDDPLYDPSFIEFTPSPEMTLSGGQPSASRLSEGTTSMGLSVEQFRNTSDNFGKVTFNVVDGYQKILPVDEVTVTIRGRSVSTVYDGREHSAEGYDVSISSPLYSPENIAFSGAASVSAEDAGEYPMGLSAEQFSNNSANFSKVSFEVTDGSLKIAPASATVRIIGRSNRVSYDGEEHSVSGYTVAEMSRLYSSRDFVFTGMDTASRTEAGTGMMGLSADQFVNTNSNFADVRFDVTDGYMAVDPVTTVVRITGHTGEAPYDGREHAVSGFDIEPDNELLRTGDIIFSGNAEAARTDAGTTFMGLSAGNFSWRNDNFSNVVFQVTDGSQTVMPVSAAVTITGHHNVSMYDRNEHTVSGYDAVCEGGLYRESDFSFCGEAEAARVEAGTTMMGLAAEQFVNNNANFSEVTFNVTDGYQTVTEAGEVAVTITGHRESAVYDGREHSVSGYDVAISDPMYTENDFSFSGNEEVSLTDAGTSMMGLKAEDFSNTNENFSKVTFNVIDGSITVNPASVELTAASAEREYNGLPLTAGSYEITSGRFVSGEGIKDAEITGSRILTGSSENRISGYSLLDGTKAGNYDITLVSGTLTVTDRSEKFPVLMKAVSGEVMYDGAIHTVSGFESEEFNVSGHIYVVTGLTAEGTGKDAGTYDVAVSGAPAVLDEDGNNVTAQFDVRTEDGQLRINKRSLVLTSASKTAAYSGDPVTAEDVTVSGDGFAPGEGASYEVTGTMSLVGIAENLFSYILNDGTKSENYEITAIPGILTVTNRDARYAITMEAESGTFKYDGEAKSVTGFRSTEFMVGGNLYTVSGLEAGASAVHAGTYPVTVTGTPVVKDSKGNDVSDQFSVTAVNGSMEITRRSVELRSASKSGVYDGNALTDSEVAVSGDGFAPGDGAEYQVTGTRTAPGSAENTFTYVLNEGTLASDYDIRTYAGSLTVTARPDEARYEITISSSAGTALYDGLEHTAGGLIDGITGKTVEEGGSVNIRSGGHVYTVSGLTASASGTAAGTYPVNISGTPVVTDENGNDVSSEFVIHMDPGSLVIARRDVILTSSSATHAYTGKALTSHDVSVSGDGFASGEGAEFSVTGTRTLPGISANTFIYKLKEGTDSGNYNIRTVTGQLNVLDRDAKYVLTLTPASGTYLYDGEEKSVEGFVSLTAVIDGVRYEISGLEAGAEAADAGTYTVNVSGTARVTDEDGNDVTDQFAVETGTGMLIIRPRTVVLSTEDVSREYDGTPLEGGEVKISGDGFAGEDGVDISGMASRTLVGVSENSFDWAFSEGTEPGNYDVSTVFGLISVTNRDAKYEIRMIANSDTVVYDGEEHEVRGFETSEFEIDGNTYSVGEIESEASGIEAGVYGTELTGEAVVSDEAGEDVTDEFAVSYESGTLTITAAEEPAPSDEEDGSDDGNGGGTPGGDDESGGDGGDNNGSGDGGGTPGGSGDNGAGGSGSGGSGSGSEASGSNGSGSGSAATDIVGENGVPFASAPLGYWALLNLIMMIITACLAVINAVRWLAGRRAENESDEENQTETAAEGDESARRRSRRGSVTLASIAAAIIAVIAFFLTEDMTNTMTFIDKYTILMAVILIAGLATTIFGKKKESEEDTAADQE